MISTTRLVLRQVPAVAHHLALLSTTVSAGSSPSSFNPEAYLRFPQFLHDINNKLMLYKTSQETQGLLAKGKLVYSHKCVTVEGALGTLSTLSETDREALKQLSIATKGLFWQSDIDYTCVPCVFPLAGDFTPDSFLAELGLDSASFKASLHYSFFSRGTLHKLPIISYQGEDAMNVYKSPTDIISTIFENYDEVYHLTVGEGVINPVLHFIVAKCDSGKLLGFMSASFQE